MNKEARYLIRLGNHSHHPDDQATLIRRVRTLVAPFEAKAINLRVSSKAIEFDLFCAPITDVEPILSALEPMGRKLTCKRLDVPPPPVDPEKIVTEARSLFNEERFWEVHEVLEGLWKKARDPEKKWVQGLILAAAALVHRQKDEEAVVAKMIDAALLSLQGSSGSFYGWDLGLFLQRVIPEIQIKKSFLPKV